MKTRSKNELVKLLATPEFADFVSVTTASDLSEDALRPDSQDNYYTLMARQDYLCLGSGNPFGIVTRQFTWKSPFVYIGRVNGIRYNTDLR